MNRWIMAALMGVMLLTTGAAHWLREPWKRGFRPNPRTVLGDAYGRENRPFGYVPLPHESGYAPGHAPMISNGEPMRPL